MKTLILSVVGGLLLLGIGLCVVVGIYVLGIYNTQATLKNTYESKVLANQSDFDNMWKKISQSVQIADKQKDGLKDILVGYANARTTDSSNVVMNWIKESVPNADLSLYKDVHNTIMGSRDGWTMRQKELVDTARVYNQNLVQQPSGFILKLFGFEKIDAKVITSSRTEKAFETGKDDNVDLK